MSKKMQLPDEALDSVSGGALTFDGQAVTGYSVTAKGISLTTASGTTFVDHDEDTLKKIAKNPKAVDALDATIQGLMSHGTTFAVEELDTIL